MLDGLIPCTRTSISSSFFFFFFLVLLFGRWREVSYDVAPPRCGRNNTMRLTSSTLAAAPIAWGIISPLFQAVRTRALWRIEFAEWGKWMQRSFRSIAAHFARTWVRVWDNGIVTVVLSSVLLKLYYALFEGRARQEKKIKRELSFRTAQTIWIS